MKAPIPLLTSILVLFSPCDIRHPHPPLHTHLLLVTSGGDTRTLEQHLVVATETERCTVSKRAVCILLECCFFTNDFYP